MKVKTDIIASITESPIGPAVILVIMYVMNFKTDISIFINNTIMF